MPNDLAQFLCEMFKVVCIVLESIVVSVIVGLATGAISSWLVARRFYKKALLDDCSRLLRRLCPYRKSNVREGDGLEETSWALKIQSEIKQRLFSSQARESETKSLSKTVSLRERLFLLNILSICGA